MSSEALEDKLNNMSTISFPIPTQTVFIEKNHLYTHKLSSYISYHLHLPSILMLLMRAYKTPLKDTCHKSGSVVVGVVTHDSQVTSAKVER